MVTTRTHALHLGARLLRILLPANRDAALYAPRRDGDVMAVQDRATIPALVRHMELLGDLPMELHARYADDQTIATALETWRGYMLEVREPGAKAGG